MLKIGSTIINLNAVAYVDLEASKSYVTRESTKGVKIHLLIADNEGTPTSLFFSGEEAEYLREYFKAVDELHGGKQ